MVGGGWCGCVCKPKKNREIRDSLVKTCAGSTALKSAGCQSPWGFESLILRQTSCTLTTSCMFVVSRSPRPKMSANPRIATQGEGETPGACCTVGSASSTALCELCPVPLCARRRRAGATRQWALDRIPHRVQKGHPGRSSGLRFVHPFSVRRGREPLISLRVTARSTRNRHSAADKLRINVRFCLARASSATVVCRKRGSRR